MKKLDKIKQDSFYIDTLNEFKTIKDVIDAGWFDDGLDCIDYNTKLFTTPLDKIIKSIENNVANKPLAILFSTGGFAPFHQGHLDMMELSKKKLEEKGYFVCGGYLSPSHDNYVLSKYNNSIKTNASQRIYNLQESIENSNWLMVDPWEALHTPSSINFTDVYQRLKEYISNNLNLNFSLFYVFGSDNYFFHRAFIKKGNCCCVERSSNVIIEPLENDRIFYIKNTMPSANISSKQIRDLPYLLRDDSIHYQFGPIDYSSFLKNTKNIIEKYSLHETIIIPAKDQQLMLNKLTQPIINIDKITFSENKINVSRIFNISDGQFSSNRLNMDIPALDESKEYALLDDDIASGSTMRLIKEKIPHIKIKEEISLAKLWYEEKFQKSYNIFDIVDLRDFLFGSRDGGLLVELPDLTLGRAPYIAPFVNLVSRAKIDSNKTYEMSKEIIQLNIEFYKINSKIQLKDCDPLFINFAKKQGFQSTDNMIDVCARLFDQLFKN